LDFVNKSFDRMFNNPQFVCKPFITSKGLASYMNAAEVVAKNKERCALQKLNIKQGRN